MNLHKKTLTYQLLKYSALCISLLFLLPLASLIFSSLQIDLDSMKQIYVYLPFLLNTAKLAFPSAFLACLLGFMNAWFISCYNFPARKVFAILLLTPLTMPLFINSMIWIEFLDLGGPVYTCLKSLNLTFDINLLFKDIRSYPLAIFVYSILLYPYAYLIGLNYFSLRDSQVFESAMSLGTHKLRYFLSIELFLILPYFSLSFIIIVLEIIADYGAAEIFALQVISVGIFNLWTIRMQPDSAIILAILTLFLISILISIYALFFNKQHFKWIHLNPPSPRIQVNWSFKTLIILEQISLFILTTLFPLSFLIYHSWNQFANHRIWVILESLLNSLILVSITTPLLIILSIFVALAFKYCFRTFADRSGYLIYLTSYGIPGVMIAIGSMLIFIPIDTFITFLSFKIFHLEQRAFLLTSGFVLVIAMLGRFSGMSVSNIYLALKKIPEDLEQLAFSFDHFFKAIYRAILPLMSFSISLTMILLILEIMRELPITMLLRPFDFETLAIYSFSFASEEDIEISAFPSLLLVLLNFIILFFFVRFKKLKF